MIGHIRAAGHPRPGLCDQIPCIAGTPRWCMIGSFATDVSIDDPDDPPLKIY